MFKRIVFNQFYDLTRQGKDPMKARVGAVMLLSVLIILPLFILFFLNLDWISSNFRGVGGSGLSGKTVGKLLGAAILGLVFGIIFLVLGSKSRFERYWAEFSQLSDEQKRAESKKGISYFLVPFFLMLALVLYMAFQSV